MTGLDGNSGNTSLVGYPDVNIKNNYISSVKGVVHYRSSLCSKDEFTVKVGQTYKNSRGLCLITRITGQDAKTNAACTPYSSVGTTYHEFIITKTQSGTGCAITRFVQDEETGM